MAPSDPTAEERYYVEYSDGIETHTIKFFVQESVEDADFITFWNSFIDVVGPLLTAESLVAIRHAAAGAHFSTPVVATGATASWGSGTPDGRTTARFVSFIGRGLATGVRARLYMFGLNVAVTDGNFRFTAGENGQVDAAVDLLNGGETGLVAINGDVPLWYPYANHGYNAYWQRHER